MFANEKYTGTVTLLDSATQEYQYQMKECHPPLLIDSEFRAVQEEKLREELIYAVELHYTFRTKY